jgi:uncharacterized protein CbrC (UPF0167 family)
LELPTFRYHPNPIATGSVVVSNTICKVCGQARGYVYVGSFSGPARADNLQDAICPWRIADGRAHREFDVGFTDRAWICGYGDWEAVPPSVVEDVACRTPGFIGWQQERWFTHCGDAAEFLGPMGRKELAALGPEAVEAIHQECGYEGQEWQDYYEGLDRKGSPTAYLFRCRHCGQLGGYSDMD